MRKGALAVASGALTSG